MMKAVLALFIALVSFAAALYGPKSDVVQVGADNFKQEVLQFPGVAIVEFYAPWCGHCKQLTPEYEKAASQLKGVVKIVAVDATAHESLAQKYQIQGFPTLKVFGADKKNPVDYQGQRTADGIVSEGMRAANQLVKDRKAGKSSNKKDKKERKADTKPEEKQDKKKEIKSSVVELTDVNFDALVSDSSDIWLVEFYAPWCGHCKKLAPEWEKAATRLSSEKGIKVAAVDATAHTGLAQRFGIKGFPTIKVFPAGANKVPQDYAGAREAQAIIDYALDVLDKAGGPVQVDQLTSQSIFDDTCKSSKLCAILFLPHILDSGAKGRNSYLNDFQEIANGLRKLPIKFVWAEGGAHSGLESSLGINSNYPTLAVLSTEKKIVAVPKVSWSKKNMESFLNGVIGGTEKTSKLNTIPAVETVAAWDGKDGKLIVDEIPLDELFGDEL